MIWAKIVIQFASFIFLVKDSSASTRVLFHFVRYTHPFGGAPVARETTALDPAPAPAVVGVF